MSIRLSDRDSDDLKALEAVLPDFEKKAKRFRPTGSSVLIYTFSGVPRGGLGLIRHSAKEDPKKEGTTSAAQYKPIRDLCRREDLNLSHLVVTFGNSGDNRWEHRPDLLFLHQQLRLTGLPPFVAYSRDDRFTRHPVVADSMLSLLRSTGLDLWFADQGKPIDPIGDELIVRVKAVMAAYERRLIARRTRGGMLARWEAGYITGSTPIGFDSDDGVPILEPAGYEIVRTVFERASDSGPNSKLAHISAALATEGIELSPSKIATILREEAYVTGVLTRTDGETGDIYRLRRVEISDPISPEDRRRALRNLSRDSGTDKPVHSEPLRGLIIAHADCHGGVDDKDRAILLESRIRPGRNSPGDEVVMHTSNPGSERCKGLYLDARHVERLVALGLYKAAECLPHHEAMLPDHEAALYEQERVLSARLDALVARFGDDDQTETGELDALVRSASRTLQDLRRRIETLALDPRLTASSHHLATRENLLFAAEKILLDRNRRLDLLQLRTLLFRRAIGHIVVCTDDDHAITNLFIYGNAATNGDDEPPRGFFLNTCSDILIEHLEAHAQVHLDAGECMVRTASQGSPKDAVRNIRKLAAATDDVDPHAYEWPWVVHLNIPMGTASFTVKDRRLSAEEAYEWTIEVGQVEDPDAGS